MSNFLQTLTSFLFFSTNKNVACSSSIANATAAAIAKGRQPAVETLRIPATEAERERFKVNRCQWSLGRLDYAVGDDGDYEWCLLVEHVVSLFADVSRDAITVPIGYAHREGFPASPLRLTAPAQDNNKQVLLMCRRNYKPVAVGICVVQIISQNLQCICRKFVFIPLDMIMCGLTSPPHACVDVQQTCIAFC
ncbi:hypothetical protein AAC387_Pa01g2474 [Persea americana]